MAGNIYGLSITARVRIQTFASSFLPFNLSISASRMTCEILFTVQEFLSHSLWWSSFIVSSLLQISVCFGKWCEACIKRISKLCLSHGCSHFACTINDAIIIVPRFGIVIEWIARENNFLRRVYPDGDISLRSLWVNCVNSTERFHDVHFSYCNIAECFTDIRRSSVLVLNFPSDLHFE